MSAPLGVPGRGIGSLLLAIPDGARSPAPRVRVLQFVPWFERAGFRCKVAIMREESATARSLDAETAPLAARMKHLARTWLCAQRFQWRLAREVGRYDQVLLHRIPISSWGRSLLVKHRERLVFDFDDALYDAEPHGLAPFADLRRRVLRRSLENAIAISRLVVTSNDQNADFVRSAGGEACVIPTSVDTERIAGRRAPRAPGPVVIGWMGTPSTSRYLPLIEEAVEEVARRRQVIVRLVGAERNPFRAAPVELRPWSLEAEAAELNAFDIGIMPMPDTVWTRGKAAYKALQYGAACLPTVASWTRTNEEILGRGGGVRLCRGVLEWTDALDSLSADESLRLEMGRRARELVVTQYSLAVNGPKLVQALLGG